jgi:tRNA A37 threonylcarbamoyladenosine synthetase subunit TsaC/SUA5/YrdC
LIEGPLAGAAHPVLQTSANLTGERPPARFSDVEGRIAGTVDLAIDGGELGGAPSSVVDLSGIDAGMGWRLLREGALSEAELTERLGKPPSGS